MSGTLTRNAKNRNLFITCFVDSNLFHFSSHSSSGSSSHSSNNQSGSSSSSQSQGSSSGGGHSHSTEYTSSHHGSTTSYMHTHSHGKARERETNKEINNDFNLMQNYSAVNVYLVDTDLNFYSRMSIISHLDVIS